MNVPEVRAMTLDDKYRLEDGRIYLTGVQALVRLLLTQRRLDRIAGLDTAGFVSGYRGSPLGTLDRELWTAGKHLASHDITFTPGLNEDLAATAVWGSQQVGLFPKPKHQGVFGMWYAKAPGVDRSGDALRHANYAGTAALGGVLALAGDDHACKSASLPSQSDFTFRDACIPMLNPANIAEVLRFGLLGFTMSRFSGLWIGMKCLADTMDSAASIAIADTVPRIILPTDLPEIDGGVSIRWPHAPLDKERLVFDVRLPRAIAFARANGINRVLRDEPGARIAIVSIGKSTADVGHALGRLEGLPPLRLISIGMPWPLDDTWLAERCLGMDTVLVVEEKRSLVEEQLASALYRMPAERRPRLLGKTDELGRPLLPALGALSVGQIEAAIAHLAGQPRREVVRNAVVSDPANLPQRLPYFCSGCPHNRSTKVPEGSIALAGIGCHYMAQWMDRSTVTFSQMGSEGTTWIGMAPFSGMEHVFANLGDGTYAHSGLLAIRAAIASGVNITYKLLYNDAVAMTGGQTAEGGFTVPQIAAQLLAEGAKAVEVVAEDPERFGAGQLPAAVRLRPRADLTLAERRLKEMPGVTVIIYDQVCATEKRRRRKRGDIPQAARRVLINEAVCEGCGDCGKQSNCVSIVPAETPLGRKRQIDQTSCNQDLTCADGFCPSFVSVEGGGPAAKKDRKALGAAPAVPDPVQIAERAAIVVGGIGGTGIVTIGAILGTAAHLEGRTVSVLDMIGLSQKAGEVNSHLRIGCVDEPEQPARIAAGEADLLLGGDLLVSAGNGVLPLLRRDAGAVVNTAQVMTADFTAKPDLVFPERLMIDRLTATTGMTQLLDASALAERLLGNSVGANIMLVGAAWQRGQIPLSKQSIRRAIELNGLAVAMNLAAFDWGRALAHDPAMAGEILKPATTAVDPDDLEALLTYQGEHLRNYQNTALADRHRALVERVRAAEMQVVPGSSRLALACARGYHKLLAYKDEYEVARLLSEPAFLEGVRAQLGTGRLSFHLAPPVLPGRDASTGRPRKRRFGPWLLPALRVLAGMKGLRGTAFDPFGWLAERRVERAMIVEYERMVAQLLPRLTQQNLSTAIEMFALPETVRGFGSVKEQAIQRARKREKELHAQFEGGTSLAGRSA